MDLGGDVDVNILDSAKYIEDACYPISITIENIGLQSEGENAIVLARQKYNRAKKSFTLHYVNLHVDEFELLANFYEQYCDYGAVAFFWRYPFYGDSSSDDISYLFQDKIFYVYISKFSFKAVSFNKYQGDVVLSET